MFTSTPVEIVNSINISQQHIFIRAKHFLGLSLPANYSSTDVFESKIFHKFFYSLMKIHFGVHIVRMRSHVGNLFG